MKKWLPAVLAVLVAACGGDSLEGTYTDEVGVSSYTFSRGGKVLISGMGVETEAEYRLKDGKVRIGGPRGGVVMTVLQDGSIQAPMGVKLTKQGS